jgi:GT2 family glycosyltransferase
MGPVMLGFPVGFNETEPYAASVRRLCTYEMLKAPGKRLLHGTVASPGLYVDDNRTSLVKRMLVEGVDWLFQVDTDIEFQVYTLERMVGLAEAKGLKILAASVPIGDTYPTAGFMFGEKPGTWAALKPEVLVREQGAVGEPVEVDAFATACCIIHREVFEEIARREGRTWFDRFSYEAEPYGPEVPMENRDYIVLGEDFAFSRRARDAGIKMWCAYIPGLRHWKMTPFSHDAPWPTKKGGRVEG